MADSYHPQQFFEVPAPQFTNTSSEVPAQSFKISPTLFADEIQLVNTSTQIPSNKEIVAMMELYAPGHLTSWPDDLKPQYRIPEHATEVFVDSGFPALTVAF